MPYTDWDGTLHHRFPSGDQVVPMIRDAIVQQSSERNYRDHFEQQPNVDAAHGAHEGRGMYAHPRCVCRVTLSALFAVALAVAPRIALGAPHTVDAKPLADPAVNASAGVASFIDPHLRHIAGVGETWTVRLAAGRPTGVRLELAYTGSAQPLDQSDGSRLLAHGAEATLRINMAPGEAPFEPFMYFGGGWMHFHATTTPGSQLRPDDDVFVMPIGVGLARTFGSLIIDIRGGVEVTSGGDLLPLEHPSSSHDSAAMHRFGLVAGLGYRL